MTLLDRMSHGWKAWALLFLITFAAAAPGVVMIPALDRDESRFAQASKQMLEEGDFILIRYQDELRNKKPVGIHWLQAASTAAFTGPEAKAIWTHRVPSWLGAAFATLACFWAGIPLIGRRASFLGAALLGATILLTTEAHIAKTDALLACLTTLALGGLARLYSETGTPRAMAVIVWAALGAAFLVKGPVALMVAGFAAAGVWLWDKRRTGEGGRWWRPLLWLPGPALFLLIVLPWFIAVEIFSGGTFLAGAVGEDLSDKVGGASEGHGGPPGYHLLASLVMFFPAILLLIPAIMASLRSLRGETLTALGHGTDGLRFLLAWAVPTWLFFEILPTKLVHYVLPAYPALALLCGYAAVQMMDGMKMPRARGLGMVLFAAGAILLLTVSFPGVTSYVMDGESRRFASVSREQVQEAWLAYREFPLWFWAAGFALAGLALVESARARTGAAITLAVCASLAIGWHVRGVMLPSQAWLHPTETARAALEDVCGVPGEADLCNVPVPARVLALGYSEPSYVMTLGTQNLHSPKAPQTLPTDPAAYPVVYLLNFESRGEPAMTDIAAALRAEAISLGACLTEGESHYALNYSNGRPVHFRAWRFDWGSCP
ncbi:ArnT family glycosyltransferase [Hyphomonas sp.]|uniref:ArnT family glycosyltransferase n=1 Tax=Hyphomonas sp. TaxID=87 RepID=UPI003919CA1E